MFSFSQFNFMSENALRAHLKIYLQESPAGEKTTPAFAFFPAQPIIRYRTGAVREPIHNPGPRTRRSGSLTCR